MELNDLVKVFDSVLNQDHKATITSETDFKESEAWSSLTAFEITAILNDKYGIKLRGIQIRRCKTIAELYALIASE